MSVQDESVMPGFSAMSMVPTAPPPIVIAEPNKNVPNILIGDFQAIAPPKPRPIAAAVAAIIATLPDRENVFALPPDAAPNIPDAAPNIPDAVHNIDIPKRSYLCNIPPPRANAAAAAVTVAYLPTIFAAGGFRILPAAIVTNSAIPATAPPNAKNPPAASAPPAGKPPNIFTTAAPKVAATPDVTATAGNPNFLAPATPAAPAACIYQITAAAPMRSVFIVNAGIANPAAAGSAPIADPAIATAPIVAAEAIIFFADLVIIEYLDGFKVLEMQLF